MKKARQKKCSTTRSIIVRRTSWDISPRWCSSLCRARLPFRKLALPFRRAFCRSSHANGCDRSTSCTSVLWRLLYLTVAFRSRAIPDSLLRTSGTYSAGWSSLVARRAHNPEVVGSNPAPATKIKAGPSGRLLFCCGADAEPTLVHSPSIFYFENTKT